VFKELIILELILNRNIPEGIICDSRWIIP